jgi:hypothetical protein
MGIFDSIGKSFKSLGQKIGAGAQFLGKKTLVGLDYTIQGAKIATDFADKYTLGLDHFLPYYSALKAGIDISDHVRKMIKGEEKFNLSTGLDIGTDLIFGGMGLGSAKGELEGIKDSYKIFNEARGSGRSLLQSSKGAGSRLLKGYGLHKSDFKEMATASKNTLNMARRGNLQAIAKTGIVASGVGVVGASQVVEPPKQQAPAQAQQKKIQPQQPRILQAKIKPIIHSPPLTKEPINLEFRDNGIYQYGKLVG